MAMSLTCSLPTSIRASFGSRNHDPNRKRTVPSASANWWAPLFGWSSDPDYIPEKKVKDPEMIDLDTGSGESGRPRSKIMLGCFTEEKAKELRKKTKESYCFHDKMYHSAIASRLASDISVSSEK